MIQSCRIELSRGGYTAQKSCFTSFRKKPSALSCKAEKDVDIVPILSKKLAIAAAAVAAGCMLNFGGIALANEFDIFTTAAPSSKYILDDANVLSISTEGTVNERLKKLEEKTGYRLEIITIKKLDTQSDLFSFGDKVLERWYPTLEEGDKKGILLISTTGKEGAVSGGPAFINAVGDKLIESLVEDDVPILTEQEKFNEVILETTNRIEAVLTGKEDPGGPVRKVDDRKRTYKTKEETEKNKDITSVLVVTLLVISVVVPMLQYYGYTAKE